MVFIWFHPIFMLESKRIPCSALAVHKNITQSLTKSDYEKSFIGPHMGKVDNLIFAILSISLRVIY